MCAQLTNFRKVSVYGAKLGGKSRYFNQVKGFEEEAAAFVRTLHNQLPSPINFAELYAVSKTTIAAIESMQTGQAVQVQ